MRLYGRQTLAEVINQLKGIHVVLDTSGYTHPQMITTAAGKRLIGKTYSSRELAAILNRQASMLAIGASDQDFRRVAERCQIVYFDLKLISAEMHLRFTGVGNEPVLRNLSTLSQLNVPFVIRVPLVPGVTDGRDNLSSIAQTVSGLKGLVRVDALPYNRAAGGKYSALGMRFYPPYHESALINTDLTPFKELGIPIRLAGCRTIC